MTSSLPAFFDHWLPRLDDEIRLSVGQAAHGAYVRFYGMLHYHLGWADADFKPETTAASGKRIRPMLCLLVCEASGGYPQCALPAAAAIELLHNFSLIHDDVEDASDLRRGRPTLWKLWGAAQAINAGDALFSIAHAAFHRLGDLGVPADRQVAARTLFDRTCLKLTQGQFLDLSYETRGDVSVDEYLHMIDGKTAALVSGSAALGAILAGADSVERYARFGRCLGMAFQIQDDVLGIWGDPGITGKSAASDIISRKKSLPVLYGLESDEELRALYAAPEMDVARAVDALERSGAKEHAARIAGEYTEEAMAALEDAHPQGRAADALRELARTLLGRQA